jgi:aromatic ring-cleaving dioxygenase
MHTFHAHIYFSMDEIELATSVKNALSEALPQLTYIGRLIPKLVGPHTMPMFEIHIPAKEIETITVTLNEMRRGLSVLIHPVQENELEAHTVSAVWLGQQLPLNLHVL